MSKEGQRAREWSQGAIMKGDYVPLSRTRGIRWWLAAALAPIGIFGGPLALADLVAGLIEWKSWIAFLVHYWDVYVSDSVKAVLDWVAAQLALPRIPELVADYITVGLITATGNFRTRALLVTRTDANFLEIAWDVIWSGVAWPIFLVENAYGFVGTVRNAGGIRHISDWTLVSWHILLFLPLAIFLTLLAVNLMLS